MKILKKIGILLSAIAIAGVLIVAIAIISLKARTEKLSDDYSSLYTDEAYSEAIFIDGIDVIKQDISCGYAVIEMFSTKVGKNITEESLYDTYGKVVTSTGKSFEREMNRQFPEYKTTMYKYQTDSELIKRAYMSLKNGIPVPFEWAARYDDTWTLHYSLLIGMDIPGDKVTVLNPYGYTEELKLNDFLRRTSYDAYEDLPLFLEMGFAFGFFEKNTIFIAE